MSKKVAQEDNFFFFYFKHVLFERDNCAQQILFLTLLIYSEIQ